MTYEEVNNKIEGTLKFLPTFEKGISERVNESVIKIDNEVTLYTNKVDLRVLDQEVKVNKAIINLTADALYHINRSYGFYSPSLLLILGGIIKAVSTVIKVVKTIVNSKVFKIIKAIHKIAMTALPAYKKQVNKVMSSISDFSNQIKLGVDGLQHFMNACNAGWGIVSGIMGHEDSDRENNLFTRSADQAGKVAEVANAIASNPIYAFNVLFDNAQEEQRKEVKTRWDDLVNFVDGAVNQTAQLAYQFGEMTGELAKFEQSLPDFVRQYIPQEITVWLGRVVDYMMEDLPPILNAIKRQVNEVDSLVNTYGTKLTDISTRLGKPGTILLGVDDLPEYAKQSQLTDIDDVTSRKFSQEAEADYAAMSDEIDTLESIAEALTAPTPQPSFLDIESPARAAVTGIVAEPHETWFVGDY